MNNYKINRVGNKEIDEQIAKKVQSVFSINSMKDGSVLDTEALEKCGELYYVTLLEEDVCIGYMLYTFNYNNSSLEKENKLYKEKDISGVYINQIAILPKYQRLGVASHMYRLLEQRCKALCIGKIYAHVSINSTKSMIFHCAANAFFPIGEYSSNDFHGKLEYKSLLLEKILATSMRKV